MTRGKAYGVGVGPGDPELLTLKALRVLRSCEVVATPGRDARDSLAYRIAVAALPELRDKELVALPSPMVLDREAVQSAQRKNARHLHRYLDRNQDVACLVLGDPSLYSTFTLMASALAADGYDVELVSGVPSFCAAAACLGWPLAQWDEPLHILPACHEPTAEALAAPGTHVLMKAGRHMREVKELLRQSGLDARAVECCGLEGEKVHRDVDAIPDHADYLTVVLAR